MYAVDLHAHTRFFHGYDRLGAMFDPVGVQLLAAAGRYRHLDGVALTNHDYYRDVAPVDAIDVAPIPGIEISTTDGHVVVVGPNPPRRTEPGALTPEEAVDIAHDRGCAAIVAHPYRNSVVRESDADFDAIEVNGKHPRTWSRVEALAERLELPLVGGSDAHYPIEVGRAYTAIDADELTPEAVVDAIRDGHVQPHVQRGRLNKIVRMFYRRIHQRKGYLDPGDRFSERQRQQ